MSNIPGNIPVIFVALANDPEDPTKYLAKIKEEEERIRQALTPAEKAGLCELEFRYQATASDIFQVFRDERYRNRIAIFHFGGHANAYDLLLHSPEGKAIAANARGLAAFLREQQQGLQLVFLNACSTEPQVEGLLDANVGAVIATSRKIDDGVATDFSAHFYQGLASGAGIQTAFRQAAAEIRTNKGENPRALYIGGRRAGDDLDADRWPWNLNVREGSEGAANWNLPEAVGNPLFGLPELPLQDLPDEPYRYLKWFTSKDADVFFGRGNQIRELHDRITNPHSPPIILFFGQSGVGKSSILDAGLLPRLSRKHEVRYLRRDRDKGLANMLRWELQSEEPAVAPETDWQRKEKQLDKSLVVILDQVEEVFTRPNSADPNELRDLLALLDEIFGRIDRRPKGKLVLGFRKEWLAELEERFIAHGLPRIKVFLEPLDHRGVIEVVQGPVSSERLQTQYKLTVDDGLAGRIANDLLQDRGSSIAPTLQILLTKMWEKATEANPNAPHFTEQLYLDLKQQGILLGDFLDQQVEILRKEMPHIVESGLLLDLVALHTTPWGTADQLSTATLRQDYAHLGAELEDVLRQCQELHLLTISGGNERAESDVTRLAHDTLAPLIRERFENSDKPGQRARRILDNRVVDWTDEREGNPLGEADLKVVEEGIQGTRNLTPTEQRLVNTSRELVRQIEQKREFVKVAAILAVTVILSASGIAFRQKVIAVRERGNAETERVRATKSFQVSLDAVDKLLAQVSENLLINEPRMHGFRNELLLRANRLLAELKNLRSGGEAMLVAYPMAEIMVAIGKLNYSVGAKADALSKLKDARTEVEGALRRAKGKRRELLLQTLGNSWTETGNIYLQRRDELGRAKMAYEQAFQVRSHLDSEFPDDVQLERQVANAYMNKAIVIAELGEKSGLSEMKELMDKARQVREKLLGQQDLTLVEAVSIRLDRADQLYSMSRKSLSEDPVRQVNDAIDELEEVLRIVRGEKIVVEDSIFEARLRLAQCYDQRSYLLRSPDDSKEATKILQRLITENPSATTYIHQLGKVYNRRYWLTGSEEFYKKAIATIKPLLKLNYDGYSQDFALAKYQRAVFLGDSLQKAGSEDIASWERVRQLLEDAIDIWEPIADNKYRAEQDAAGDMLLEIAEKHLKPEY